MISLRNAFHICSKKKYFNLTPNVQNIYQILKLISETKPSSNFFHNAIRSGYFLCAMYLLLQPLKF